MKAAAKRDFRDEMNGEAAPSTCRADKLFLHMASIQMVEWRSFLHSEAFAFLEATRKSPILCSGHA